LKTSDRSKRARRGELKKLLTEEMLSAAALRELTALLELGGKPRMNVSDHGTDLISRTVSSFIISRMD
jgi:hypothetical protein